MELLHALGDGELDRRLATGIRLALLRHEGGLLAQHAEGLEADVRSVSRRWRSVAGDVAGPAGHRLGHGQRGRGRRYPGRPMIVDDVRRTVADGRSELSARVRPDDADEVRVWFACAEEHAPQGDADATPVPAAGAALVHAPRASGWSIDGPVSPKVLDRLDEIQGVMSSLFPGQVRPIEVEAGSGVPPAGADLVGCCFSRGVDSWHTILSTLAEGRNGGEPPTHLVFSPGHVAKSFSRRAAAAEDRRRAHGGRGAGPRASSRSTPTSSAR